MTTSFVQSDSAAFFAGIQACSSLPQEIAAPGSSLYVKSGSAGTGSQTLTVDSGSPRRGFYCEGVPGFLRWDGQDWTIPINVQTGDADFRWDSAQVCRITAGGLAVETLGILDSQDLSMSVSRTMVVPGQSSIIGSSNDRFYIVLSMNFGGAAMHGSFSITIDNDQTITGPEVLPPAGDTYLPAYIARHRLIPHVTR